jgi:septum formation protein
MAFSNLYLASSSPRRKELLSKITNNFKILTTNYVEPNEADYNSAERYICTCVESKAAQVFEAHKVDPASLVLVADTTVFLGKRLLGKPKSKSDAISMLEHLSGKQHEVFTGYWLGPLEKEKFEPSQISWEVSKVQFRKLSRKLIEGYVHSKEPMDKAGAYGFQGLGLELIASVQGSYSNIMGLPILSFQKELSKWELS